MNLFNKILLFTVCAVVLVCAIWVILQRRKTKKILKTLHAMLDSAMDGSFTEKSFDESLLSSVENRFNQYLSASEVSVRNLTLEKNKIKELIADISHQTKTPLANILLYAQLLEEQELPEQSSVCVKSLNEQAQKLSFLITSLVKLSRLETGILTLHPTYQSVQPMLDEVKTQCASAAAQKQLKFFVDSTNASAIFDLKWTTEAVCNLVDNAIKYTPANGTIHISVKVYELFCRINVADSGIGISETEQAKIFTRFYRSQSVSEQEGVGIGLYLTRQILAQQGGYIKVASSLGNGAVFSAFLPKKLEM